jgi:hypothetical protein
VLAGHDHQAFQHLLAGDGHQAAMILEIEESSGPSGGPLLQRQSEVLCAPAREEGVSRAYELQRMSIAPTHFGQVPALTVEGLHSIMDHATGQSWVEDF